MTLTLSLTNRLNLSILFALTVRKNSNKTYP